MNCFWNTMNTIDAGIMISAEAAMVADRSVWGCEEKNDSARGSVWLLVDYRYSSGLR